MIYIVDSADRNRIKDAELELHNLLTDDTLHETILLVFANKQGILHRVKKLIGRFTKCDECQRTNDTIETKRFTTKKLVCTAMCRNHRRRNYGRNGMAFQEIVNDVKIFYLNFVSNSFAILFSGFIFNTFSKSAFAKSIFPISPYNTPRSHKTDSSSGANSNTLL